MPYPNEHACRLRQPSDFKQDTFRRTNGGEWVLPGAGLITIPETISVISGQLDNQTEGQRAVQALRFPIDNWTWADAKKWVKDHNVDYIEMEEATSEKADMSGEIKYRYADKEFSTREELYTYLRENKSLLKTAKKSQPKFTDAFSFKAEIAAESATKASGSDNKEFGVKVVINTTKLLDSHGDVHIDGLWKKSLTDKRTLYLLNSHGWKFEDVITDKVIASTQNIAWTTVGANFTGDTQALVFDCRIDPERNKFMADQYRKGYVRQHSVGMQYVQLHLCMNSTNKYDVEEKANWDKYIGYVANLEEAEEKGYFWAVTEAKVMEGSAVLFGSNPITPTLYVEPSEGTRTDEEPEKSTLNLEKLKSLLTQI